jgi:hypothetical protein
MARTVAQTVEAARRRGCPLIAVNTPDPAQTVHQTVSHVPDEHVNGTNYPVAKLSWDLHRGFRGLNDPGRECRSQYVGDNDPSVGNPVQAMKVVRDFPAHTIVFVHMGDRFLREDSPAFVAFSQGVWNIRDEFKRDNRVLILLGSHFILPPELKENIILLDEPLPDREHTANIIREVSSYAGISLDASVTDLACEAAMGQCAYAIEQNTALSLSADGLLLDDLWERKRKQIEQTPGLKVFRGGETFASIGGMDAVKEYLSRLAGGKGRPNAIVRIDEIDKMLDGQDLSGVSQDQLGVLLSYMEDSELLGLLFVGPPGASKSLCSKAAGNEAGIPTIDFDLGACKGSLVGQSEARIRDALRVITAVSNEKPLFIATCNRMDNLNTALQRRFATTFYFDLPDEHERPLIWNIHAKRYGLQIDRLPNDQGWAGSDIRNCCKHAHDLNVSLLEASQYIVPVGVRSRDEINTLRKQAEGKLLSASYPGVYTVSRNDCRQSRGISI